MILLTAIAVSVAATLNASTALAESYWYSSDGDETALSGEQNEPFADEFKVDGTVGKFEGVIRCEKTTYSGWTSATTATTLSLSAAYDSCEMEPFGKATITMNGCQYVFHAGEDTGEGKFDTETTIECPEGKEITISAVIAGVTKCTVHVEPQNIGTGVVLTNEEAAGVKDLKVAINFSNIKYTQTEGTGFGRCTTTSTTSNGVYSGSATVQGESAYNGPYWLQTDGDWTVLQGEQGSPADELKIDGIVGGSEGKLTCKKIQYSSSTNLTTTTTITLQPLYSECELAPFGPAVITMNGCSYTLHADGATGVTPTIYNTETTLECPEGKDVTITASISGVTKCTVHIEPQNIGTGAVLTSAEAAGVKDLKVDINFSKVKYTQTAGTGSGVCTTTSTTSNGVYIGSTTLKGKHTNGEATSIEVAPTAATKSTSIWIEPGPEPEPVEFNSEAEHSTVIGEAARTEEFLVNAGTAECSESVYKGTMEGKAVAEITVAPEYGSCTAFGFSSAEVKANGCAYVLHSGEKTAGKNEGEFDIECPEGKTMEVVAKVLGLTKCVVTIGAQSGLTAITYTNEGSGSTRDVKLDLGATGIGYTQHTGEGLGKCSAGTFEGGEYNGVATVIAENAEKKQVGFWVE